MSIDVRVAETGELRRLREVLGTAFGDADPAPHWDPVWENVFEHDRLFGAYEAGDMVGVAGNFSFSLAIPGGEMPAAGLTIVGVLPTHRRKGILRKLMTTAIDDARARAESVSILWASEEVIYQRFGYGLATNQLRIEVDRAHTAFRDDPGPSGRVRLLSDDEAIKVLPGVYERVRATRPGMLGRHENWWKFHRLSDPKEDRGGGGTLFKVAWESDGQAEAYALYRVREKWDHKTGISQNSLWVLEAMAMTPQAHRELWRYLFSIDLVQTTTGYFMPVDDPLPLMLAAPRRLRMRVNDALWLRLVDVGTALQERSYDDRGALVFELTDRFCPENEGTWRLATPDGTTTVEKVNATPELTLDACDLGAVYLGGTSFRQLARAGRVEEMARGSVARADALFRTSIQPWCPEIF